jgi:RNA polymerase sporulation-specific sigma factor
MKKQLEDKEVKRLIAASQAGERASRDELILANTRLVWSIVQRFVGRGYESEDLFQIGSMGLMKAIDKFDLSYDVRFSTYAVPMIIGEIQRFIRDDGMVKVSRTVKELGHKIRRARETFEKTNGRSPTVVEIAELLDVDQEDVLYALEATRTPSSIYETVYENDGDPILLVDQISDESHDKWFDQFALKEIIQAMSERERTIIYLRFYRDQTQAEVASRLGISQVQVSRLEKKILQLIREEIVL